MVELLSSLLLCFNHNKPHQLLRKSEKVTSLIVKCWKKLWKIPLTRFIVRNYWTTLQFWWWST